MASCTQGALQEEIPIVAFSTFWAPNSVPLWEHVKHFIYWRLACPSFNAQRQLFPYCLQVLIYLICYR